MRFKLVLLCHPYLQASLVPSRCQSKIFQWQKQYRWKTCWFSSLHWNSDSPIFQTTLVIFFRLDFQKILILHNWRLGHFHHGFAKSFELVMDDCYTKFLIFFPHQNLDNPKFPKKCHAITFDLSPHSRSSLSATTAFISPTKVAIESFLLLLNTSGFNYNFCSLRLTSDSPKTTGSIFKNGVFSIFWPKYSHKYLLDVFLQSLNQMLTTWLREVVEEIVEMIPFCGSLMDQNCQKLHLVLTHFGIQTHNSSAYLFRFFSIKVSISIALYLRRTVRS